MLTFVLVNCDEQSQVFNCFHNPDFLSNICEKSFRRAGTFNLQYKENAKNYVKQLKLHSSKLLVTVKCSISWKNDINFIGEH